MINNLAKECARDPPFVRQLFYVPRILVGKTRGSEESTCNKSFPVLDCYLLHLQWTMFLSITKIEQFMLCGT